MTPATFENLLKKLHGVSNARGMRLTRIELDEGVIVTIWYLGNIESFRPPATRSHNRRGGGTGVYIRSTLKARLVAEFSQSEVNIEQLWVVIDIANNNYLIGTIYRPPGGQVLDAINSLEHSIASMFPDTDNIILMGDLNLNLMQVTPATDLLTDLLDLFNITQIIKAPTCITKNCNTLLDIIAVGDIDLIDGEAQHVDMHQVTDHQLVFCQLKIKIPQNKIKNPSDKGLLHSGSHKHLKKVAVAHSSANKTVPETDPMDTTPNVQVENMDAEPEQSLTRKRAYPITSTQESPEEEDINNEEAPL
ncbi:hypothetical protein JTB14_011444 [Gonioctena quinquepunctata]|nr:hypothetical protein JTB14_011444 [Gonioctena quinquepunctata]